MSLVEAPNTSETEASEGMSMSLPATTATTTTTTTDTPPLTAPLLHRTTAGGGGDDERRKPQWYRYFSVCVFLIFCEKRRCLSPRPLASSDAADAAAASDDDNSASSESDLLLGHDDDSAQAQDEAQAHEAASAQDQGGGAHHHVIKIVEYLEEVAGAVKNKDLKWVKEHDGVDGVWSRLKSLSAENSEGAGVQGDGPQAWNTINPVRGKGFLYFLVQACNSYAIFILSELAILSFCIESLKLGVKYGWHDSFAIVVAIFALVACPSVGNYLHERKLARKELQDRRKLEVSVERNGSEAPTELVSVSDVVVGNVVHLKKGDRVPADGLFIDGVDFVLDEAANCIVDREQNPFVLSGSKVVEGHGRILVVSVGANTSLAQWMSLMTHNPNEKTLFQALMNRQYGYMEYLTLGGSVLIALVVLIRTLFFGTQDNYDRPELKGEASMVMKMFEFALKPRGRIPTLASVLVTAVIGIQHGMPLAITLALTKWNEMVVQYQAADPQNLSVCATLGLVTVLCIGTPAQLLCDQIEVVKEFWMDGKDLMKNVKGIAETNQNVVEALHRGISATPPTSQLLVSWLKTRWGTDTEFGDKKFDIREQRKLRSNEECSGILISRIENDEEFLEWHCNGVASTILDMCSSSCYGDRGESTEDQMRVIKQIVTTMEESGLRPLAYAYKKAEALQEFTEDGFILLAIVGLERAYQELKFVVEAFRSAGVIVKLVSEDDLSTVTDRALKLGICSSSPNDVPRKGEDFRRMNSSDRLGISVVGNSLPKDKILMVKTLKGKGEGVAFYGGLTISEMPTLKEADVGITDDIRGTEIARENADLIIRNVCSINHTFKSGVCASHNIRQFSQIQLTACISGLLITVVVTMHSGESPLTAIHLIWVNLIMCLLGGLMMVMELPGTEVVTQRQVPRTQSLIITPVIWSKITIKASYQASVLLILHFMGNVVPSMDEGVRNTMIFNTFTLCQVVNLLNAMDLVKKEVRKVVLGSYWFLMALGVVLVMQVVIVEFGKGLASAVKLTAVQWAICCLLAAVSWGFDWAITFLPASLRTCGLPY